MKQDPVPVPPGLDWDAWQVDAPKKPFKQGYTGFRAWWEYGSGLVGDWGAHHVDVANWFMNADEKVPLKTAAVGFYARQNVDPECVYDSRNRKTNASMEIGYNSALPCLLALEAMAQNRVLGWDTAARKSKPV